MNKNEKNNKIHKEGWDAGYEKGFKEGTKHALTVISEGEGWEESRDNYARKMKIPTIYGK